MFRFLILQEVPLVSSRAAAERSFPFSDLILKYYNLENFDKSFEMYNSTKMALASSSMINIQPSMRHRMSTHHVHLQTPKATLSISNKPTIFLELFPKSLLENVTAGGLSLAAAVLLFTAPPALAKEDIIGQAKVVDGDTLVVDGTRIRMFGIDAPETKQSCSLKGQDYLCGTASKAALEKEIGSAPVRCQPKQKDLYGRTVAICRKANARSKPGEGKDLNAWMVSEGWAVA